MHKPVNRLAVEIFAWSWSLYYEAKKKNDYFVKAPTTCTWVAESMFFEADL